MNIEGKRDLPSETISRLTPTLDYFKNLNNDIPKTEIIPIIEVSSQRRKDLLEQELKKGKLITNKKDFETWVLLLEKNNIINIKTTFDQINPDKSPIIIQSNEQKEPFNYPFVVFYKHPDEIKGKNGRLGFIDNNGNFISNITKRDNIQVETSIMSNYQPSQKTPTITTSEIPEKKPDIQPVQKVQIPKNQDIPYQIKKGDYLWKIISEQYNLHPKKDQNAIWQIMEQIRKDPRNKSAIKDIETIFAGETINLPKKIKTTKRDISIIEKK